MNLNPYNNAKVKFLFHLIETMDDNRTGSRHYAMVIKLGDFTIETDNYKDNPPFINQIRDELGNEIGHFAIFSAKIPATMKQIKWEKFYHHTFSVNRNSTENERQFSIERHLHRFEQELIISGIARTRISYEALQDKL